MSDSLQPHVLYSPWNSPGQSTRVGSLSLLHGIFPTQGLNPGLLHCKRILYQLSYQGSPKTDEDTVNCKTLQTHQPSLSPKVTQLGGEELGSHGSHLSTKQKHLSSDLNTLVSIEIVTNMIYWHLKFCSFLQVIQYWGEHQKSSFQEHPIPKWCAYHSEKPGSKWIRNILQMEILKNHIVPLILWKIQVAKPEKLD